MFSALLGRVQDLACWTLQCSVGLESKVLSREAASFPGGGRERVGYSQMCEQASW